MSKKIKKKEVNGLVTMGLFVAPVSVLMLTFLMPHPILLIALTAIIVHSQYGLLFTKRL